LSRLQSIMSMRILRRCCDGVYLYSILEMAVDNLGLSARAYSRVVKSARTIADLDNKSDILRQHVDAVQYRNEQ